MHNQNLDRMISYYAKMLIVVSITLLSYGIFLQINTTPKLSNLPIDEQDEKTISVTPVDSYDNNTIFDEEKIESNAIDETNSNKSIEEINNQLRKKIQDNYGITIYYGKQTDGYKVSNSEINISAFSITSPRVINQQLNKLEKTLALYPNNFFKEIDTGGIPLSIYLVNNYSDSTITGITDSTYNYANISVAAIYPFEESFFHESYHYIERYLFKKGANFNSWDSLNPSDFQYGKIYNQLSYTTTFSPQSYFVNNYAQVAPAEDRASTFEYMMATNKASCLNENNTVWQKAKYIARTIETVLNSVKPNNTEYWERHL